jgi:hypothetical protein
MGHNLTILKRRRRSHNSPGCGSRNPCHVGSLFIDKYGISRFLGSFENIYASRRIPVDGCCIRTFKTYCTVTFALVAFVATIGLLDKLCTLNDEPASALHGQVVGMESGKVLATASPASTVVLAWLY